MTLGFIFSGQGAQYQGMGKEFLEYSDIYAEKMTLASEILGYDVSQVIDDDVLLHQTEYTQPAILAMSCAVSDMIKEELSISPTIVAGLSLGEYTALVESGALSFADALKIVQSRGKLMAEAVPKGVGAMSAIIGLDREIVLEACREAQTFGVVIPANYNMPLQIAIAGELAAVIEAERLLKDRGARRIIRLNVSGPFHTPLMQPAAEKLVPILERVTFQSPIIPVVTNVTGKILTDDTSIVDNLMQQVMSPVYWEDGIQTMINHGVNTFVEIGPGKALSGFVKKIDKDVAVQNVDTIKTFEKLKQVLKNQEA